MNIENLTSIKYAMMTAINQLDMAGDCVENGKYDEALLHCRSLRRSKVEAVSLIEKLIEELEDD